MGNKVTVFGANGKVGSRIVADLLAKNYSVTAFVHATSHLPAHPNLTVSQGDIYNAQSVESVIEGADVVVSALGSWGTPKKDVLTTGMMHIIASMKTHGVTRIVSLTGAEARATDDTLGFVHRIMHTALRVIAGKILRDGERHIALLERSGLQWTVIRSPIMTQDATEAYQFSYSRPYPWKKIPRRAVVRSMVDAIEDDTVISRAPFITRG